MQLRSGHRLAGSEFQSNFHTENRSRHFPLYRLLKRMTDVAAPDPVQLAVRLIEGGRWSYNTSCREDDSKGSCFCSVWSRSGSVGSESQQFSQQQSHKILFGDHKGLVRLLKYVPCNDADKMFKEAIKSNNNIFLPVS